MTAPHLQPADLPAHLVESLGCAVEATRALQTPLAMEHGSYLDDPTLHMLGRVIHVLDWMVTDPPRSIATLPPGIKTRLLRDLAVLERNLTLHKEARLSGFAIRQPYSGAQDD